MKKFILFLFCAIVAALGATAQNTKTFTDRLVVTVNGESSDPMQATVDFTLNADGTCNFSLPNFVLGDAETTIPVGNININNIPLASGQNGVYTFEYTGIITISEGNDTSYDFWLGPSLGELPLTLKGKVADSKIYVAIDLDLMEMMEQIVYVQFGDDDFSSVVGINAIGTQPVNAATYDLQGRRVNRVQNGVVVGTGRKMIRK